MKTKIGYFIPEFPGQTHIFLWRERQALIELGIEAEFVSTRCPPKAIASHIWSDEAQKSTTYLIPFAIQDFINSAIEILKAGPMAWSRSIASIINASDTSLFQKLRLFGLIVVAGKLAWLAKRKGWSHIHCHSCADAANVVLFASILADITYSLTLHGPTLEVYGLNQSQKWKYASFGLVVSEKLFHDIRERLAGFLPQKIAVAPMGINLQEIKRHSPYIPGDSKGLCRIFSCGRLNPVKGHQYLIETISLLRQWGFDVYLQIAGEDEQGGNGYHLELAKIIRDRSLSQYIDLLGAVSEARICKGLEEAHVFALASLNEGVPVAVMEAMAMEIPVVVTDVGGTAELVDNGVDGILVAPEHPQEMAECIAKIIQNREFALSLSQKSREKVTQQFHHRRSAEILAQFLNATTSHTLINESNVIC
jgi:colanic acid/amylovoran biosynthesis glycosyltransferase